MPTKQSSINYIYIKVNYCMSKDADMIKMEYKYELINSNASSAKLGPCEICGNHVNDFYHQIEERKLQSGQYTRSGCSDLFGHKECLLKIRK